MALFNPLSANPTKWSNTLKQFVGRLGEIISRMAQCIESYLRTNV